MSDADKLLSAWGIDSPSLCAELQHELQGRADPVRSANKCLQGKIYHLIFARFSWGNFPSGFETRSSIHPEITWRKKWKHNLTCLEKHTLRKRIMFSMRSINTWGVAASVPPRVLYACIRLGYHGWPTASRCGRSRHCCPLCRSEQDDSVNHAIRCPLVRSLL